jgi:hypothetical protein
MPASRGLLAVYAAGFLHRRILNRRRKGGMGTQACAPPLQSLYALDEKHEARLSFLWGRAAQGLGHGIGSCGCPHGTKFGSERSKH